MAAWPGRACLAIEVATVLEYQWIGGVTNSAENFA
jgi:hypothetical protein